MVHAFFDDEGHIYTNYVPRGKTVNANYIVEGLSRFLGGFQEEATEYRGRRVIFPMG